MEFTHSCLHYLSVLRNLHCKFRDIPLTENSVSTSPILSTYLQSTCVIFGQNSIFPLTLTNHLVTYLIQCGRNIQDNPCDCTDNCYRSDKCCFRKIWIKGLSQVSMHFLINLWVLSFLTPFLPCFLPPPVPLHLLSIVSQSLGPFCLFFYLFLPSPSSLALFYLHLPPFL